MSKRIKALMQQAASDCDNAHGIQVPNDFVETFAELIILECAAHLRRRDVKGFSTSEERKLKEHFGFGKKQEVIEFCGVPLVRVTYIDNRWQVQMRAEDSQNWFNVGNGFKTSKEAVEAAPELCEF